MDPAGMFKGIIGIALFFMFLYSLAVLPAYPWLMVITIAGALALWKSDKILSLIAKLTARRRIPKEKEIKIPEAVAPTVGLPKKEELKKMDIDKLVDFVYNLMSQQNKIIVELNATIAELRGKLEREKQEKEQAQKKAEILNKWLGVKDEKELMKKILQLGYASYLYGVPVVGKDGKKLGTFVAIVPDPTDPSGRLICLVQNAYGQIVPAGYGMTVAHPKYFPLFDPQNFQAVMRELQEYGSYFLEGGKLMRFGDIIDHALVLASWQGKIPSYVDVYADLAFPQETDFCKMAVIEDRDTATIITEQRNKIEELRRENQYLRYRADELEREVDYLRVLAATALQRLAMREAPDRYVSTIPVLEGLVREMERADTYRRVTAHVEEARERERERIEALAESMSAEAKKLAGRTTLDITEETLNTIRRMTEIIRGPRDELLKAMTTALSAGRAEERKGAEERKEVVE